MMLSHSKVVIGSDAGCEVLDTVQMWEKSGQGECHCKRLGCGIEAESVN